jgi:hypothetical protein
MIIIFFNLKKQQQKKKLKNIKIISFTLSTDLSNSCLPSGASAIHAIT